jgi:hypothetical protein
MVCISLFWSCSSKLLHSCLILARTEVKQTSNERRTKVGRKSNKCWMKRQDGKTVRRTTWRRTTICKTARLERIFRRKSDGRLTNQGRNDGNNVACNVATTMVLQLATLLLPRGYCCRDVVVAIFVFFFYLTDSGEKMTTRKRKRSEI